MVSVSIGVACVRGWVCQGCFASALQLYIRVTFMCLPTFLHEALGGITYLRYDDTNPETEDERYIREIKEMVEWLGKRWEWLGKSWGVAW